MDQDKSM